MLLLFLSTKHLHPSPRLIVATPLTTVTWIRADRTKLVANIAEVIVFLNWLLATEQSLAAVTWVYKDPTNIF